MPQLHLCVPMGVANLVRRRARARNMTVSGYLAELVKREVASTSLRVKRLDSRRRNP